MRLSRNTYARFATYLSDFFTKETEELRRLIIRMEKRWSLQISRFFYISGMCGNYAWLYMHATESVRSLSREWNTRRGINDLELCFFLIGRSRPRNRLSFIVADYNFSSISIYLFDTDTYVQLRCPFRFVNKSGRNSVCVVWSDAAAAVVRRVHDWFWLLD